MRAGDILNEEVFSSLAVAYHRTRNLQNTNAIGDTGFKAGDRGTYGRGIYLTYAFDDQQDDRMKELYGPFIIRCKVNLNDFVIFDRDIAARVYGPAKTSLEDQFKYFGVQPTGKYVDWIKTVRSAYAQAYGEWQAATSHAANPFANWLHSGDAKLTRSIKGLVFSGEQDGRVIVAYDPSVVIPFAWARVIDLKKTRETVKWNKIAAPPIAAKPAETMPEFQRAYRFFRERGFTLIRRGTNGALLMGMRTGDYLSIVVTEREKQITVKAFCNRVDPIATKVPGWAERRGWPLIYRDFTTALPLQEILTTIMTAHTAMTEYPERHVAFTEALLHHITKPGGTIQRENKPGADYRQDDIVLIAGSITVVLDSPYQDFTSGKLTIASQPVPLRLGFNDGAPRGGTANLPGAYESLVRMAGLERIYERLQWQWPDDLQPQFVADLLKAMKQD